MGEGTHEGEEVLRSTIARALFHEDCDCQGPAKEDDKALDSVECVFAFLEVVVGELHGQVSGLRILASQWPGGGRESQGGPQAPRVKA